MLVPEQFLFCKEFCIKKVFDFGLVLAVLLVPAACAASGDGGDQIKLWQDFVIGVLNGVFTLPVAIVFLGVLFREPLSKLIRSIRRIRLRGFELVTDLATVKGVILLNKGEKKRERVPDDNSPEAAIIAAYAKVDTALREKYAALTGNPQCYLPANDMITYLWEKGKIDTDTLIVADSMGSLREHIFYPDVCEISKEQLEAYKQNANTIAGIIRNIETVG
jgi:hypothetical protein